MRIRFATDKPVDNNKFTLAGATARANSNRIAMKTP